MDGQVWFRDTTYSDNNRMLSLCVNKLISMFEQVHELYSL